MSTVIKAVKSYCSKPQIAKPGSSPYSNAYKSKKIFEINGSAIILTQIMGYITIL